MLDCNQVEAEAEQPRNLSYLEQTSFSVPTRKGTHRMLNQRTQIVWWQATDLPRAKLGGRTSFSLSLYLATKRLFDLLVAVVFSLLLAPLMLLIAIAIKIETPGPVLHVQLRSGLNGRVFRFYKFRSMTNGHDHTQEHRKFAEAYINGRAEAITQDRNGPAIYKPSSNGHTITRVGHWLRRTSLDELPQLFNMLKGDMSLIGPRPAMDYETALFTERHRGRLAAQPGLTGWAQIHGRSSLSFEEIITLDLEYVAKRSIMMDLKILLATIPQVLSAKNAG
jgi:lipopolysaccharide/colanic/teichoic acid biosynthesis glycosyltransferase